MLRFQSSKIILGVVVTLESFSDALSKVVSYLYFQLVSPVQVSHLIDTDNPSQLEEDLRAVMAKHRNDGPGISSKTSLNSITNNISEG